jgi:serpin B
VEEQTNDKIKDLIPQGTIDALTRLVLTNAIYFKGKWALQFDAKNTKKDDFKVSPGETVKVDMMEQTGKDAKFNYAETENLQALEMPYKGNELSMLVLLPKEDSIKPLEESLSVEKIGELRKQLVEQRIDVYFPKFTFETKYFMVPALTEMGMPTAFSPPTPTGGADFTGMTAKKELFITNVIHQAFVKVDEEGTEAAAATAVIVGVTSMPLPPKEFRADHPFIFIIQEKKTGSILFIGKVADPTAE